MNYYSSVNHDGIKALASKVLEDNDIMEPVVDVAKIAKSKGIEIKEINMPSEYSEVAGFYDKAKKIIYVEATDHPRRKLFSIAHELGHVFLNHQNATVLYRKTKKDDGDDYSNEEKEANSFADHLLMPDFMLKEYLRKFNLSASDYGIMADLFGVPTTSMKHTLQYLN
jgi:Zn-dependent peptidase ImmA (M78 family)